MSWPHMTLMPLPTWFPDQGDEGLHAQLRSQVVTYMRDHEDMFAPFIEDDESFGTYVVRMKKVGAVNSTWGQCLCKHVSPRAPC